LIRYVSILDGSDDAWAVRIPDLPGCHGRGANPEAAIGDASSAAREWPEHRIARGTASHDARPLGQIIGDGDMDPEAGEML